MSQGLSKYPAAPRIRPVTQPIPIPLPNPPPLKRSSEVSDFSKYVSPKPNNDNVTRYFLTRQSMPPEYQSCALDYYFKTLEEEQASPESTPSPERKTESVPLPKELDQISYFTSQEIR